MKKRFILLTLFLFCSSVFAQDLTYPGDPFATNSKPPLQAKKLVDEFGAGLLGGLLAGVVGFTAGFLIDGKRETTLTAIQILYPVGAGIGASVVGNSGNEKGSFLSTLGFSVLFSGLTYLAYPLIPEKSRTYLYIFSAPLGAVIGHNLTRSYDDPIDNALLQLHSGRFSLHVPVAKLTLSPSNKLVPQWHLLHWQF